MSTTTAVPDLGTRAPAQVGTSVETRPSTVGRVVRSEWIKLRSLRSTWIMLGSLAAAIVAFGLISASVATGRGGATTGSMRPIRASRAARPIGFST